MCDITAVNIQILETQEKRTALLSASEEETATQTPRSTLKSYDDSAGSTMCKSKSGDSITSHVDSEEDDDDDDDDGQPAEGDDEYYAFLREMAGSFDNGSDNGSEDDEESESESDSEEEAEDEEEDQPSAQGRSSAAPTGGLVSPPTPAACGCARTGGRGTFKGSEQEKHETEQDAPTPEEQGKAAACAGSTAGSTPPKAAAGGSPCTNEVHRRSANWCPIPERDNRPPVEDDYDVVQATRDFSLQRSGDKAQQHREDLCELIQVKRVQAQTLLKPAGSPHSCPDIRAHYARVRSELLSQASALESELCSLDQAQMPFQSCAGESFNGFSTGLQQALQELRLGQC